MKNLISTFSSIALLILLLSFATSCNKENEINENPITSRSFQNEDIEWLIEFQSYLYAIQESLPTTEIYSPEEAAYGVEALLNIRYCSDQNGIIIPSIKDSFSISITSDWLDLLDTAEIILLEQKISAEFEDYSVSGVNIEIYDTDIDSVYFISHVLLKDTIKSHFENYLENAPTNCGYPSFVEGEEYYLWLGGTEFISLWDDTFLDCEFECGDYEPGTTAAMEEIQNIITTNYPLPSCGPGRVWTGKFVNIVKRYADIYWSSGLFNSCEIMEFQPFYACDCLDYELLNCMMCIIVAEIESSASPIVIPDYNHLIYFNVGIDFSAIGDPEEFPTKITIDYTYGIPVCASTYINYAEDILEMELMDLLCC